MQGGHESVLSYRISEVQSQRDQLLTAVTAKRAALDARRDAQQHGRQSGPVSSPPVVDQTSTTPNVTADDLALRRRQLLGRLSQYYTIDIADLKINGRRLPDKDGFPESLEHSQGLGLVCHLLTLYSEIYSARLPHPIVLCGDHSKIAEHIAITQDRYLPLFPSKAHDRLHLRRAVELLRANISWMTMHVYGEGSTHTAGVAQQLSLLVKGPPPPTPAPTA